MWLLHLPLRPSSNSQPPTTCSKTWTWILLLSSSSSQQRSPNLLPSQWTLDKHQLHNNSSSTTVVVYLITWTSQLLLSKASPSSSISSNIISKILNRQTLIVSKITSCSKLRNITLSSNSPHLKPTSLNNQIGLLMFPCLLRNKTCGLRALTCSIWVIWRLVISKSWKVWTRSRHLGDPLPCKGHPCMGRSLNSKIIIKLRHPLSLFPCQTSVLLSTATLNNSVSLNNNSSNSLSNSSASNLSCNNSNNSSLLTITRVGSISSNSLDSVLSNHHSSETTTDKALHSWND